MNEKGKKCAYCGEHRPHNVLSDGLVTVGMALGQQRMINSDIIRALKRGDKCWKSADRRIKAVAFGALCCIVALDLRILILEKEKSELENDLSNLETRVENLEKSDIKINDISNME